MASGSQNMTTYLAKGLQKVLTTSATNTDNLLYINTADTNITADILGASNSIAFTRMDTTGAYTAGHIVWLNVADIGTPFQLVIHDNSDLYFYKRYKSNGTWSAWTKMKAGTADTWTTARTLTVGGTGKSVDGSADISWSMDDIMGSSTNAYFYRGDKVWSNDINNTLVVSDNHFLLRGTGAEQYIDFQSSRNTTNNATYIPKVQIDAYETRLIFYTNHKYSENTTSWSEDLTIKYNGNVGLGFSDPGYKLAVNGTGYFTDQLLISNYDANRGDVYSGGIQIREYRYQTTSCTENWYNAPGVTFHWGGRYVSKLGMYKSLLRIDSIPILTTNTGHPRYHVGSTASNSYVLITINAETSWMLNFTLKLYQSYVATDIQISGYNYGSNHWYSPQAVILGSTTTGKIKIYFGYTGNYKLWVAVDGGNYNGADVVNVCNGYTQIDGEDAFTLTKVNSLPGTTQTTVEAYRPWHRNETVDNATTAASASSVAWSGVSSKPATATRWPSWSEVTDKPSTFAPSSHTHSYLPLSGGTMTGVITTTSGSSDAGIHVGDTYINAIGKNLIVQNCDEIRFGTNAWDYNQWAGMRYDNTNKYLYIGFAYSPITRNSNVTGHIFFSGATSIRPYTNNTANIGSTDYEWGTTYSRAVYARHYESSGNYTGDYNMYYGYSRCTNHYFYRGTTGGGQAHVATININGITSNYNLGVSQTAGTGAGLSLYNGTGNVQNYGIWCGLAGTFGNFGLVTNDWNMYFGMAGNRYRGWVFRGPGGAKASINTYGDISGRAIHLYPGSEIGGNFNEGIRVHASSGNWATIMLCGSDNTGEVGTSGNSWGFFNNGGNFYITRNGSSSGSSLLYCLTDNYWRCSTRMYGAVWNDYAEYRQGETTEGGRVVYDDNTGIMKITTKRMQAAARIISDTFGFAVGESETAHTPIGVGGRVLAFPYQNRTNYHVGDAVCAAPNGTVDIMTREEIIEYPDRIIGIVSEIPQYNVWINELANGGRGRAEIKVNGRIWIYVR